jgi:hypothetical protein
MKVPASTHTTVQAFNLFARKPAVLVGVSSALVFACLLARPAGSWTVQPLKPPPGGDLLDRESHLVVARELFEAHDLAAAAAPGALAMSHSFGLSVPGPALMQYDVVDWAKTNLMLSSADIVRQFDLAVNDSPEPEPEPRKRLIIPLSIILIAGGIWRFYTSSAYEKVYENLFGPLHEY